MKKLIAILALAGISFTTFAATGTIIIKNPNGKSGTKIIIVVTPEGKDFTIVVPPNIGIEGFQVGQTIEFIETGVNTGVLR